MELSDFEPKFITFDCYGTLTNFQMAEAVAPLIKDTIAPADVAAFNADFRAYRMDEVLGPFKLYPQLLRDSWLRACNRWRIQFKPRTSTPSSRRSARGARTRTCRNLSRHWPRNIRW